jgi:hypothetical protein
MQLSLDSLLSLTPSFSWGGQCSGPLRTASAVSPWPTEEHALGKTAEAVGTGLRRVDTSLKRSVNESRRSSCAFDCDSTLGSAQL